MIRGHNEQSLLIQAHALEPFDEHTQVFVVVADFAVVQGL
jgi:hypothetical protein